MRRNTDGGDWYMMVTEKAIRISNQLLRYTWLMPHPWSQTDMAVNVLMAIVPSNSLAPTICEGAKDPSDITITFRGRNQKDILILGVGSEVDPSWWVIMGWSGDRKDLPVPDIHVQKNYMKTEEETRMRLEEVKNFLREFYR